MHDPLTPQPINNEPLLESWQQPMEALSLPKPSKENITIDYILQVAKRANTRIGAWKAFLSMNSGTQDREALLRDLTSPAWFEEIVSIYSDPDFKHVDWRYRDRMERIAKDYTGTWRAAHGLEDTSCDSTPEYVRGFPPENECKYGAEMLQTLSLSQEQEKLRSSCQYIRSVTGMISGPYMALHRQDALNTFAERAASLKISEDYMTLATDAWLLSVLKPAAALEELEWVLKNARGQDRELAVRLTEDVVKRRHNKTFDLIRQMNSILPEDGPRTLSPEQYERLGAYPGEFYSAWSNLDHDHAIKVLKDNLANEDKARQLSERGGRVLIEFALDAGDKELAWQLWLALDNRADILFSDINAAFSDISDFRNLSEWTARAPFIRSDISVSSSAVTGPDRSDVAKYLYCGFLNRLARNETEHAEYLLDALVHLNLSAENHRALHQLLRVVKGEPNSHQWSGFEGDSPYLWIFDYWSPLRPKPYNPRLDALVEKTLSYWRGDVHQEGSRLVFAALLASHGLKQAAYSFLEITDLNAVRALAYALDDQTKISWFEEIGRVRNLFGETDPYLSFVTRGADGLLQYYCSL